MKSFSLHVFYCFLRFRFTRWFRSDTVSHSIKKKWKKKLEKSTFYKPFLLTENTFPLINKALFMEHFDAINTAGIKKEEAFQLALQSEISRDFTPTIDGISIGLSSGTSGNKSIFLTSPKERAMWVGAVLDRVIGFSLKKRKIAFFLRANNKLYDAVQSTVLRFHFFDIKIPIDQHLDHLYKLKANILVAQPSVLMEIACLYKDKQLEPSFSKVISVAEVLEEDQKEFFEKVFQCRIDQVYQCSEGFLAHTCKHGNLHFNEDWLNIEKRYIDQNKTRFHPVITDYLRTSQPIVRYELDDIIHEGIRCKCGLKSTVISRIEGRTDDTFRFDIQDKEVLIYPDFVRRAIITATDEIINYVVTQIGKSTISLYIEVKEKQQKEHAFSVACKGLKRMFTEFGVTIDIVKTTYQHDPMTKFKRIRNDYSKSI